jgi:hypothetical protein
MSIETRMAIEHSTPMPHRSENGVTVRYEAKVFSLWDRKASAEVAHACMYAIVWIPAFKCIAISFLERREADSIQFKKLPSIHRRKGPAGTEEKASD